MSDLDNDKKLDELLEIIRRAPALNGGFDKLSDSISEIKNSNMELLYELQTVKAKQDNHTTKINEMQDALYDPDSGLYKRISAVLNEVDFQQKNISLIKDKTSLLESKNNIFAEKIGKIEQRHETLEKIAGENLEDLRSTISTKKNMLRVTWLLITGATAGIAKFLWDFIPNLF